MIQIENEAQYNDLLEESPIVLAYFSTPQCNVCKDLLPKVETMLEEHALPGVYVDTTALPAISGQLLVLAVPSLIVFVYGKETARFARHFGMRDLEASLERAKQYLE